VGSIGRITFFVMLYGISDSVASTEKMSLNSILVILLFSSIFFDGLSQHSYVNPSFFLSAYNPAFVASPLDYNQVSAGVGESGFYGISANMNINSIYSGIGLVAERESEASYNLALNYSYHTRFTKRQHHLLGGAALRVHNRADENYISSRFGIVFTHFDTGKIIIGLSAFMNERSVESHSGITNTGISVQLGGQELLPRRMKISFISIWEARKNDKTKETSFFGSILPAFWYKRLALGPGWQSLDFVHHDIVVRASVAWRVNFSASFLLKDITSNITIYNPEISARYLF